MNRKEWRERKFVLRRVSAEPAGYWWEGKLELLDRKQLEANIQVLLADLKDLRAGLIGTVTDAEIRDMIKRKYGWIGTTNGSIARIIFEIVCSIRNRIAQPESDKVINLRERLDFAERKAERLTESLEESELHGQVKHYRDMYSRLSKIHREDVRRRKEVRRFRLANFSIAEMEQEIARKKTIERRYKRVPAEVRDGQ